MRIALGAQPVGIVLGTAAAYVAARMMESLLAGVKPGDPATFLAAVGVVLLMTMAGSLLPAIRAVLVDPIAAIRVE